MIQFSLTLLTVSLLVSAAHAQGVSEFKSVAIGDQIWMAENLNTVTFSNGDTIYEAASAEAWVRAGREGMAAWCYYDNNAGNGARYGRLYNWWAVTDSRGLAPKGWHVASDAEWRRTTDYLGGEDAAGTKMKSPQGWSVKGNGTNESGFSGLPGGSRDLYGNFVYGEQAAYWWTVTETDDALAWYRVIDESPWYVYRTNYAKANGYSVRCIKD